MKRPIRIRNESDLYAPVKAFLAAQGYDVKGEVRRCDVVAVRGHEPPLIVELKRAFSLTLLLQGIDRLSLSDNVYLAIATRPRRPARIRRLCRRVGLGLLFVSRSRVEILAEPAPRGSPVLRSGPAELQLVTLKRVPIASVCFTSCNTLFTL